MATLRNDTVVRSADGQGTSAIVTATNIGTYGVAVNSTYYVGTTQNIFNRASGAQTLTGVSIDSNAGTATILQTARNINGTSFNGSAAITTASWGTARTLTIGSTGKSVDGSAAIAWSLAEIGAAAIAQTMFIGTTSIAINRGSASQTLTGISIDGNAATVGGLLPIQFFNNMGDNHSTRTSFDASTQSYGFGFRFIQGNTNGPATGGGSQFYSWYIGLGNEYSATGGGSYGMHVAVARNATTPYMSVRYNENNSLGSWLKIAAGYADTAGNASTVTTNANLTGHITSVGNATSLGSFTSAQLLAALTDETGTGANVFATSPTLVSPILGTPTSGNLANCTFPTLNQNTTGTSSNITAYTINQNVGTANTPSFAGIVSSAVTGYAYLQVVDVNNFWITPGNVNWGLYFETSAGGLLGGTGDSNRLGFVGSGAARFYVDLNNGNGWFGGTLTAVGNISAANLSGTNTGDQSIGNGTITIAAGTGVSVGATNTFTTNQSGATTVTVTNSGVTSNVAGTGISVSGATGAVTITNSGVTSAVAGTGVGVSAATGAVTFSIGQAVGTANSPTFVAVTTSNDGANHIMAGSANAEGIRMTPASSTTYPVFLRSINPGSGGEASPWIYKEQATEWGIWHNNPVNSIDFTKAGSGGIVSNVGGGTNTVVVRVEMGTGYVQTIAGYRNSAGTTILSDAGNITGSSASCTGNAATVTTNANLTGHITSVGNATSLGSFTSAQLLAALTDETGTGANVFATSPTLVSPILGTPTSGNLANCTFPTLNQNTTGSSGSCTGNAATATNSTQLGGAAASSYIRNDTDGTAGNIFSLITVTKSLTLTTSWLDTGISGTSDLANSGAYIITMNADNYAVGGGQYNETYTGIMYWYAGGTNDAGFDEIVLHKSGHAPNAVYINLRTLRNASGVLKLQIISSAATNAASNYIFKFRRIT